MATWVRGTNSETNVATLDCTGVDIVYALVYCDSTVSGIAVSGGPSGTQIGTAQTNVYGTGTHRLYRIVAPGTGTRTFTATVGTGNVRVMLAGLVDYNATTPEAATPVAIASTGPATISQSPSSAVGDLVVQMLTVGPDGDDVAAASSQVERLRRSSSGYAEITLTKDATAPTTTANISNPNAGAGVWGYSFVVQNAVSSTLTVTTQPTTGTSGAALSNIVITSSDNAFTGNVSATLASGTGSLSGTTVVAATAGVATFSNLVITGTGAHTIQFAATGHDNITTATITISTPSATALRWVQQPVNTTVGATMAAFSVEVIDGSNNRVTGSSANITIAIQTNPNSAPAPSGTLTVAASSGLATFSNIVINTIGTGYTLRATSSGLTLADSSSFNIVTGSGGSGTFISEAEPMATPIVKNSANANERRVYMNVYNDDGTPWAGSVTGVKPEIAGTPIAADIVRVAGALHYAQLSQAESNTSERVLPVTLPASGSRLFASGLALVPDSNVFDSTIEATVTAINAGVLTDAAFASNALTAAKFADGFLTEAKVGTGALTVNKFGDGAITAAKLADGAITAAKFGSGAITATVIADNALTAAKIAASAITDVKIATNAITSAKIATDAIGSAQVSAAAVTKVQAGLATAAALTTVDNEIAVIDTNVDTLVARVTGTVPTANQNADATVRLLAGTSEAAGTVTVPFSTGNEQFIRATSADGTRTTSLTPD